MYWRRLPLSYWRNRTGDYGQNWKMVNAGLPNCAAHAVREDPGNRNLVFAALDMGVFVSFNGGDRWQSLELNLPIASCRDLAIERNDLDRVWGAEDGLRVVCRGWSEVIQSALSHGTIV